jgi:hypothetical protein
MPPNVSGKSISDRFFGGEQLSDKIFEFAKIYKVKYGSTEYD